MKKIIFYLLIFCSSLFAVQEYEVFIREYQNSDGKVFVTLRKWRDKETTKYLLADIQTLQTTITTLQSNQLFPLDARFEKTPFAHILHHKGVLSEASAPVPKSIFLTMDMCPSQKKGYESEFIERLTQQNGKTPIAIAITSKWIENHEDAFKEIAQNPHLDITWMNHSHMHFYDKLLKDHENFMLHVNTDVKKEVLELEKTLIQRGITPSVFFRFPGLIFDEKLLKEIKETYFLIPIGSHAWVAKNEKIQNGSIILIHGNKNEPQGIEMLEEKLPSLVKNHTFKPLAEAFQ